MRELYKITEGGFNAELSYLYSLFRTKKVDKPSTGILWDKFEQRTCLEELSKLKSDGICVFKRLLSKSSISEISDFIYNTPVFKKSSDQLVSGLELLSQDSTQIKYSIDLQELLHCKAVQNVITDPTLLYLSQEYLNSNPVLDNVSAWISLPPSDGISEDTLDLQLSKVAQKFHYDMDRIKFIKYFIYLNPVETYNGPFVYVKGSHTKKPSSFRDGRYEDWEIFSDYNLEDVVEVRGDAGTVFACDTSGFHKGKPLQSGHRLVLQLEYSVSLFGAEYQTINPQKYGKNFVESLLSYRNSYSGFFVLPQQSLDNDSPQKNQSKKSKIIRLKGAPYENVSYSASTNLNKYFSRYVMSRNFRWKPYPILKDEFTQIFTIGSCFANELRAYLQKETNLMVHPSLDKDILNVFHDTSKEKTSWGLWDGSSNLQYYNTFSIRQEVEKALGLWKQEIDDLWKVEKGEYTLFQDPYRRKVFAESPEKLQKIVGSIDKSIQKGLKKAGIVILTLGLIEVWKKFDNGLIACCEPGYGGGGGFSETQFHLSSFDENYKNLSRTVEMLLNSFGISHIVLTVSPVPLGRTFQDMEVFAANLESKSILRAVAGAVSHEWDRVHYFPSYEMTIFDKNSFLEDGRHIHPNKVKQIMEYFSKIHLN
jgi:hypothetical protein